jgi:hypothetical protein
MERCGKEMPELKMVEGRMVACFKAHQDAGIE